MFLGGAAGIAAGNPATAAAQLDSGSSVAGAGDVNGDGFADVIVGFNQYSGPQPGEGAAFVYHGGAAGIADGDLSTAAAELAGSIAAAAGDVNGDGFDDVIVGEPFYDGGFRKSMNWIQIQFAGQCELRRGAPSAAERRRELPDALRYDTPRACALVY